MLGRQKRGYDMERKIVCLKSTDAADSLKDQIEGAGWQIDVTERIDTARVLIDEQQPWVGLIEFSKDHLNGQGRKLEQLMRSTPGMGWIGLADSELVPALFENKLIPGFLYDYHTLPLDPVRLIHSLGHVYGMVRVVHDRRESETQSAGSHGLVGISPVMEQVMRDIRKIALVDAPIMLSGESGTGKELAALAIHRESERRYGPFLVVNCGALPAELIQSALFGHEKGAFTGAHRRHIGRIEAAHGGTIFLDEIGDLPIDLQVNLLRFLQESTIERVGGTETVPVNVRVIAASHIDLRDAVQKGRFREDLYYRLHVLQLHMPPLRDRQSDVDVLAHHFFAAFAAERNSNVRGYSPDALDAMRAYHWPGNV
ncbi:MAG: sigma-54-dependent Fis family transcriptional regulator, partial [Gammaproteobacteria bacterium]|nr:sigma-54-dependent Fis family transcriptional regulator [Gammaproteobacteria bacterium]